MTFLSSVFGDFCFRRHPKPAVGSAFVGRALSQDTLPLERIDPGSIVPQQLGEDLTIVLTLSRCRAAHAILRSREARRRAHHRSGRSAAIIDLDEQLSLRGEFSSEGLSE
jgi:hypothetical protein